MILLYSLAIEIATWLVLVPRELLLRTGHLRERLGWIAAATPARRAVLHAASAGEMNAASALVHELAARGWSVVLSAGNEDARRIATRVARDHSAVERVVAFPWDRWIAMRRWLHRLQPQVFVVLETELWPNLFRACAEQAVPVVIAGARIEERAATRYRLLRGFFAPMLRDVRVLAVNEEEAGRYRGAGASQIEVVGSLKADACDHAPPAPKNPRLVLAASTHPGEEEWIVEAAGAAGVALVLAPRHVRRARSLALAFPGVTVVDEMGALAEQYASAAVVIIGGTFVPAGGHDWFGPARRGCALLAGPHLNNAPPVVRTVAATALAAELRTLVAHAEVAGREARLYAESLQGAARLSADRIEHVVL